MSKQMHEYSGEVTVTLKKRMPTWAESHEGAEKSLGSVTAYDDLLEEFDEGDIKEIEVDDVRKVD